MKTAFPYRYILELPTFEYGCLVGPNIKERTRQRYGALMRNRWLISHRWHDVEKLTVPGGSDLKTQHKVLCKTDHGTIIRTGITCKKIPCHIRDSSCRWLIVKNVKIFRSYVWIFRVEYFEYFELHFWISPRERNCRILTGLCK